MQKFHRGQLEFFFLWRCLFLITNNLNTSDTCRTRRQINHNYLQERDIYSSSDQSLFSKLMENWWECKVNHCESSAFISLCSAGNTKALLTLINTLLQLCIKTDFHLETGSVKIKSNIWCKNPRLNTFSPSPTISDSDKRVFAEINTTTASEWLHHDHQLLVSEVSHWNQWKSVLFCSDIFLTSIADGHYWDNVSKKEPFFVSTYRCTWLLSGSQ